MKNADMPAMAHMELNADGYAVMHHTGLTKREMFAMAAMQGLISTGGYGQGIIEASVTYADELLKELEK